MPTPKLRQWLGIELIEVSLAEKLVATVGGGLAIFLLVFISHWARPAAGSTAVIASMGASAVLLFAVPHGQLSQPWPVLAGHGFSALIGVACARFLENPVIASGCAVGLSIGIMSQLKCIHPPGGATALTAVLGGDAIHQLGFRFVIFPVLTNALAMVLLAVLLNAAFRWRRYPAIFSRPSVLPPQSQPAAPAPTHEEIILALRSLDSFVDISEEDLVQIVEILASHPVQSRPS
jgi:CBS-domain-containing membrane protein